MLPKQLQYHTSMILPALTTEEKLAMIGFNKSQKLMFNSPFLLKENRNEWLWLIDPGGSFEYIYYFSYLKKPETGFH